MTTALKPLELEEAVGSVLTEIEEASFDIPFENSDFQNSAFVMAAQQTPGRAYRAILLRMNAKIRAIKEYKYGLRKTEIDIEEKQFKIADENTDPFERRRLQLEIEKINDEGEFSRKLLNDALRELDCLYGWFKKFPRYTREQFEAEEVDHFAKKLTRQLNHNGSQESLANMAHDLPQWDARLQHAVAVLGAPEVVKAITE